MIALPRTQDLSTFLEPYQGYAYAYPHKHAYRTFDQKIDLRKIWAKEDRSALFLYIHIPFCEMRCGFCNLLTVANPKDNIEDTYLRSLHLQATTMKEVLGPETTFAQVAVGGGTPTYLSANQIGKLFQIIEEVYDLRAGAVPCSFELSPGTIDKEKISLLARHKVSRVSMGIQSFIDKEAAAMGRPQKAAEVCAALDLIRSENFPVLNVDLIYGAAGQTEQSWSYSIKEALRWQPEEIYLYPLYVRRLTGLEKMHRSWDDQRRSLYRTGRDLLLASGYEQRSMRMFRKIGAHRATNADTSYCCQEDGMVGLGAGARSYTSRFHYASEYAVSSKHVKHIINDFNSRPAEDHAHAHHGFELNLEEKQRRYVIKSLLHADGLDTAHYHRLFGTDVLNDLHCLKHLIDMKYAAIDGNLMNLTASGMEYSDAIGPWLYSDQVKALITQFEHR